MSGLDVLNGARFPVQDFVLLGGEKPPGRSYPMGAGSPRTWDKRKGYGFSGATLVFTGDDLSQFEIVVECWLQDHFFEWDEFARKVLVKPPTGKRPTALDIAHPLVNGPPLLITSVVVLDVTQWEQDDDNLWTRSISVSAFRAPQPALGKPNAAIPGVPKKVPTAADEMDAKIQAKLAETRAKGGVL